MFQIIEGEVVLRDSAGNPVVVHKDGKYMQLAVTDQVTQGLLGEILLELKKMNVHLSMINGGVVKDSDIG
jgi:hypothetical protein